MKRILFVNDELATGGVTTVLNNLLCNLDYNSFEVDLLILGQNNNNALEKMPNNINVINTTPFFNVCDIPVKECLKRGPLTLAKKLYFFFLLKTGLINKAIENERKKMNLKNYDTEVSFKEGICSVFVANSKCENKVNWIHSDYKVMNYSKHYMPTMKKVFSKFNSHVAVSKVAKESFEEIFEVNNVLVVHNIIDTKRIEELKKEDVHFKNTEDMSLISVGRLHPQKSYDRLLSVVNELNKDYTFDLYIIGNGPLKEELFKQKEELNLDNVHFLLEQQNPFKFIKQVDLFVLSSLYEGLPTVVYESFMCGVPVLTTKVAGVDEQINENNGMIVDNDEKGLYEGIKFYLENKTVIQKQKEYLLTYQYENENILKQLEEIL